MAGSLALSACGGSGKPAGGSTIVVSTPGAASTQPASPAPATTPSHGSKAAHGTAADRRAVKPGGARAGGKAGSHRQAGSAPARRRTSAGSQRDAQASRQILTCLGQAGLVEARLRSSGLWGGIDPVNRDPLLVDGPYRSRRDADTSAKSLTGVEYAERGGLYVASATLKSHLGTQVHQVAQCLDGPGAKRGALSF